MSINRLRELGVMIDCSRNAVVHVPALKRFMKICAGFGYDYIGLYTEDTLEVEGEPYFGYQRGRYTGEEIREAAAYAKSLGMELRPYIQTLAHINQITEYSDYCGHIDTGDILLTGDERVYQLLDHVLKTISETYSSKVVNIGMDEAHMVGLGRYLEQHGYEDRVQIILRHLEKVVELCKQYDLKPQMWSDMFFRLLNNGSYDSGDPEKNRALMEEMKRTVHIPEGLELVYWDYYSTDVAHYKTMLSQHKAMTDRISFAGGAWRWMGFNPYNSFSILATKSALEACLSEDIDSCVITMWGDDGTECSIYSVLPALFEAAVAGGKISDRGIFEKVTGYTFEEFMLLDLPDPGCEGKHKNNLTKILLFADPLLGVFDSLVPDNTATYYADVAKKLHAVTCGREREEDSVFRMQEMLCRVLELKADLGIRLRQAYQEAFQAGDKEALKDLKDHVLPELITRLDAFYQAFRKQWLEEAKPFGFEVQTIRIGGLRQRLVDCIDTLEQYLNGNLQKIEELETKALPVGYYMDGGSYTDPEFNRYRLLATTSRLSW
ncbi:MAG: beta-N-acetylhexosaminidase [Lachnospiraceae bacterium]|nr:beta-N-acetylhexosaminidase [Lachnospiraceae bacterium]